MTPEETALRQSYEILQATIDALCLRRDQIGAQLPNARKPAKISEIGGIEIKPSKVRRKG
jgi:hypothetical protein